MGKRVGEQAAAVAVPALLVLGVGEPLLTGLKGLNIWVGSRQNVLLEHLLPPLLLPLLFLQVRHQARMARQLGQARDRAATELALVISVVVGCLLRWTHLPPSLLLLLLPLDHLRRNLCLHHPQPVPLLWRWHCETNGSKKV